MVNITGDKMKKASFINTSRPLLCAMIQEKTPEAIINRVLNGLYDGAEAFGIQLECLEREYRTESFLSEIFSACQGRPIYVTSYRNFESTGMTDDECMELLFLAAKCGATLCDVPADTFDINETGISYEENAVKRQKEIVNKLHEMGKEVLISTHLPHFYSSEEVFNIAKAQRERSTDVVKIVNISNDEKELMENLNICAELKNQIDCEYLYLASGKDCRLLRQIGGRLGCLMYLCVYEYGGVYSKDQPKIRSLKAIRDNMIK